MDVPSASGLCLKDSNEFSHGLNERTPIGAVDGDLAPCDLLPRELAK